MTLNLLCGCAAEPPRLAGAPVFAACPAAGREGQATALPQQGCAEDISIYSPVVWLPFFGPLYDAATNTHAERAVGLSLLATVLPGIGPMIQTGLGAKQCLTQCLAADSAYGLPTGSEQAFLQLALDVSDGNCRQFLDNLPAALETAAEIAEPPARLTPLLSDTILAERRQVRRLLESGKPTAADLPARMAAYDVLCSVDHALATLADAGRNQLAGNGNSNAQDNQAWLERDGFVAEAASHKDSGGRRDGKRVSHINRINRPKQPGAADAD